MSPLRSAALPAQAMDVGALSQSGTGTSDSRRSRHEAGPVRQDRPTDRLIAVCSCPNGSESLLDVNSESLVPLPVAERYRSGMDLRDVQVKNLRYAIAYFGGADKLVNAAGAGSEKYFDKVLKGFKSGKDKNPRKLGPTLAAKIEQALGKETGWMYQPHHDLWGEDASASATTRVFVANEPRREYGPAVSDEEAEVIRDLRDLLPEKRTAFIRQIHAAAAEAREYMAMGIKKSSPVAHEEDGQHLPSAPPVERRRQGERRAYGVPLGSDGSVPRSEEESNRGAK